MNGERWTDRHTEILRRMASVGYKNCDIQAWIFAQTGARFTIFTISRRRAMLGLPRSRKGWLAVA